MHTTQASSVSTKSRGPFLCPFDPTHAIVISLSHFGQIMQSQVRSNTIKVSSPISCIPSVLLNKPSTFLHIVFYGRVGGNDYFKCAMTNMSPNLKQLWPLHPLQRRIFTVRELARAQGFPDDYQFCSVADARDNFAKVIKDVGSLPCVFL